MAEAENTVSVLCILVALISIVGNGLVCLVIIRVKSMRTSTNYLLLNLAVVDVLTGIIAIPTIIANDNSGLFGTPVQIQQIHNQTSLAAEVLCKLQASFWINTAVTPVLLMVIAYERYKAVVHPLTRRDGGVTKNRLKWILPLTWLWGLGFLIIDMTFITYSDGDCYFHADYINFSYWYAVIYLTVEFVIPCVVIFVLYSLLICTLRKTKPPRIQAQAQRARDKARKRTIIVIIVFSLTFFICSGIPHTILLRPFSHVQTLTGLLI